ncbi:hypothetical protein PL263_19900 [Methylomonas sp. EFPC3]|uniref:hypothetical protein n=1 Tax=Methylomonas sp. EFPC3 TaxID=3021710 RepID=UPI00241670DE|nr:hypothetical protein [Methylomonas sp. EFPC3]WFP50342.1 hypothetical protein PL263_19900 [Methylomonas sp. EFPC3]
MPIPRNTIKRLPHLLAAALSLTTPCVIAKNAKHDREHAPKTIQHQPDEDLLNDSEREAKPYQHYRFSDADRQSIREYYEQQYRSADCPPGLKKKRNGCLPPGQAKKWAIGRPLPRDVVYYEVPPNLMDPSAAGYRLVRVASDILMIAIGSGIVVDAITDLNRMR